MPDLLNGAVVVDEAYADESLERTDCVANQDDPEIRPSLWQPSSATAMRTRTLEVDLGIKDGAFAASAVAFQSWLRTTLRGVGPLLSTEFLSDQKSVDRLLDNLVIIRTLARQDLSVPRFKGEVNSESWFAWSIPDRELDLRIRRSGETRAILREKTTMKPQEQSTSETGTLRAWLAMFTPEQEFLEIAKSYAAGSRSAAMDRLYAWVDDLQLDRRFSEVDSLLHAAPVGTLPVALLIGLLTITREHRHSLTERRQLFAKIARRLEAELPDRRSALLSGLE